MRGIGSKIAAFFLRDVAFAFEADEKLESAPYFQPIDRWTRRGAHVLPWLMEKPKPATDNECAKIIVGASIAADRRPSLINAGLWVFGALFARTVEEFHEVLGEPIALRRFLESRQRIFDKAVRATRGS